MLNASSALLAWAPLKHQRLEMAMCLLSSKLQISILVAYLSLILSRCGTATAFTGGSITTWTPIAFHHGTVGGLLPRQQAVRNSVCTGSILSMVPRGTEINQDLLIIEKKAEKNVANSSWFPTRIQETLSEPIQRYYLRQIVTETKDMADWCLREILKKESPHEDPFAFYASTVSTCKYTKDEGGRIGWLEVNQDNEILSSSILQDLQEKRPKSGDIHILRNSVTDQYHVVQVLETWMALNPEASYREDRVGSFQGTNQLIPRRKLKGSGVAPRCAVVPKTYTIQTAGCQMNVADSERLEGILVHDLNLTRADDSDKHKADVVVLNTCSIRDHAEQKVYDALGPYGARKRKGEPLTIVVTGCVAQQEGESLLRRVPEIDVVLGPQYVPHLSNVLEHVSQGGHQFVVTAPTILVENGDDFATKPIRGHDVRAWVNVVHGCNERCTYCVVPSTRGMEQSRTMESILNECLYLADQGYKEVTLLGQNIDAYGRDMVPKRTFADLLTFLNHRLPDEFRIRYVTSHPRYFSDRVIDAVANLDKVCECFHVPFQAGDDEVLRRMRRGYTFDSYMNIIRKIRDKSPDASICGDVIVGFPGESDEAFERTLELMRAVKFDNLNSFAYSPRPNTEAALWKDQIPDEIKSERLQKVQALAIQHGLERSQRYLGRIEEVLVEDCNPRDRRQVMGRTRQGRQVYFDGDILELKGTFVQVKITEARTWSLMGEFSPP